MSYPLLFASGVHDVKNHLNALLMGLNEAYAGTDLSRLPELSARCVEMATRLDQLLMLRKTHDEGLQPVPDVRLLSDLIDNALLECQPIFESRKVAVHLQHEETETLVRVDPTLFSLILNNLLYNASVWATSSVTLHVETCPENRAVRLHIRDDGTGFPTNLVGSDLSQALDGNRQDLVQALGTGLYLCAYASAALTQAGLPCSIRLSNQDGACATLELGEQPV